MENSAETRGDTSDMESHEHPIFSSSPFKFVIGGQPFYVHAGLLSRCSKPLAAMMQSDMVEKSQGFAELEDMDQATFVRFLEWLYQGYYHAALPIQTCTVPKPTPNSDDQILDHPISGLTEARALEPEETWSSIESQLKLQKKQKKRKRSETTRNDAAYLASSQDARQDFAQRKYAVRQTVTQPRQNQGEHEDYTEVFLCHAYLYVFADKYDIQSLKVLALEELHATLNTFTLYPQRVGDVVTLLHYVYSNAPEQKNETEDLRTLMKQYVECEIDTILKDDGLEDYLMGSERGMLGDIFKIVRKRLARASLISSIIA